jgi:Secretion system C-terminal sorting domain
MKNFYLSLTKFFCILALFLGQCLGTNAQTPVTFTANDSVLRYDKVFRFGVNLGYYPPWTTEELANLAGGNPALGIKGIGATTSRPSIEEFLLETYGYDALIPTYEALYQRGMRDLNAIVGGPSDAHRDYAYHCPDKRSIMFRNMYEPIWDGGLNGTPVNENNYYALYLWKAVNKYKKYIRIWEIVNEPDFDFAGQQWQGDYLPNFGWWTSNPAPCDYQLHAPITEYVRMLRISWEVIKTADPTAHVEIGALGYPHFLDAVMRNTDNPSGGQVTAQYPQKGGAYFDLMGFHTYPHIDGSLWTYRPDNGQITGFHRHSDGAIDSGVIKKKVWFQRVLDKYGYNGVTYPKKNWTVTEFNLPRRVFSSSNYIGSEELQRNSIVKAAVTCYQQNMMQLHIFSLGDNKSASQANYEFDLMGFYKFLDASNRPSAAQVNSMGVAYKTMSDAVAGSVFDTARTRAMNIPNNVGGGAFRFPNTNRYVYILWAKTQNDYSEDVFATYSFPTSFGISSLEKREWFYSSNNSSSTVFPTNISLTSAPIYLATAFVIPVELVEFTGKRANQISHLKWQTATEINTFNFEIERSEDAQSFKKIGEVKAQGHSGTPQYYTFSDDKKVNGIAYYRLKANDLDGKTTYSKVVALTDEQPDKTRVYPNPFGKKLTVELGNRSSVPQDYDVTLSDMSGRILMHQTAQSTIEWATDQLPSGIYILKIASKGNVDTQKLVKY